MRRIALACAIFAVGVAAGIAILRPAHHPEWTPRQQRAADAVAAASGGRVLSVACTADHCGVVVRQKGGTCQGWLVPLAGPPRRAARAEC